MSGSATVAYTTIKTIPDKLEVDSGTLLKTCATLTATFDILYDLGWTKLADQLAPDDLRHAVFGGLMDDDHPFMLEMDRLAEELKTELRQEVDETLHRLDRRLLQAERAVMHARFTFPEPFGSEAP
jgi:hypothetical protein